MLAPNLGLYSTKVSQMHFYFIMYLQVKTESNLMGTVCYKFAQQGWWYSFLWAPQ